MSTDVTLLEETLDEINSSPGKLQQAILVPDASDVIALGENDWLPWKRGYSLHSPCNPAIILPSNSIIHPPIILPFSRIIQHWPAFKPLVFAHLRCHPEDLSCFFEHLNDQEVGEYPHRIAWDLIREFRLSDEVAKLLLAKVLTRNPRKDRHLKSHLGYDTAYVDIPLDEDARTHHSQYAGSDLHQEQYFRIIESLGSSDSGDKVQSPLRYLRRIAKTIRIDLGREADKLTNPALGRFPELAEDDGETEESTGDSATNWGDGATFLLTPKQRRGDCGYRPMYPSQDISKWDESYSAAGFFADLERDKKLTSKERELLRLLGNGYSSTDASREMSIKPQTVQEMLKRLRDKHPEVLKEWLARRTM